MAQAGEMGPNGLKMGSIPLFVYPKWSNVIFGEKCFGPFFDPFLVPKQDVVIIKVSPHCNSHAPDQCISQQFPGLLGVPFTNCRRAEQECHSVCPFERAVVQDARP